MKKKAYHTSILVSNTASYEKELSFLEEMGDFRAKAE